MIPEVPWRPARFLTTDFVTPNNVAIREQAAKLQAITTSPDDYIKAVCAFVRDEFTYPLDVKGQPSAGLSWKRYDKGAWWRYFYNQTLDYAWGFPNETLAIKRGICIDTALLVTSLLLAGGVPARCALGAVMNARTGEVAGYHAWPIFDYQGEPSLDEATIHSSGAETINRRASIYQPDSDWAKNTGICYREESNFDAASYEATGRLGKEMVCLMGLPAPRVECYGVLDTLAKLETRRKVLTREWRDLELHKHRILVEAYGGAR